MLRQGLGCRLGSLGCRAASGRSASAWCGGGAAPSGSAGASQAQSATPACQRGVGINRSDNCGMKCSAPHVRQGGKQHAALPGEHSGRQLLAGCASRQRALCQPRPLGAHQPPTTGQHTRLHTRERKMRAGGLKRCLKDKAGAVWAQHAEGDEASSLWPTTRALRAYQGATKVSAIRPKHQWLWLRLPPSRDLVDHCAEEAIQACVSGLRTLAVHQPQGALHQWASRKADLQHKHAPLRKVFTCCSSRVAALELYHSMPTSEQLPLPHCQEGRVVPG